MIYSVYWQTCFISIPLMWSTISKQEDPFIPCMAITRVIKESPEDSFIFIVTNDQKEGFISWLKREKMQKYVQYKSPKWSNTRYPSMKNNLQTYIFSANPNFKDTLVVEEHRKPLRQRKPRVSPPVEIKEQE